MKQRNRVLGTCSKDHNEEEEQMLVRKAMGAFFKLVNLTTWAIFIVFNLVLLL